MSAAQLQAAKQAPFLFKPVIHYQDYPAIRLMHSVAKFSAPAPALPATLILYVNPYEYLTPSAGYGSYRGHDTEVDSLQSKTSAVVTYSTPRKRSR
eukprot:jgi/Psemu1/8369/gm1.8369_g